MFKQPTFVPTEVVNRQREKTSHLIFDDLILGDGKWYNCLTIGTTLEQAQLFFHMGLEEIESHLAEIAAIEEPAEQYKVLEERLKNFKDWLLTTDSGRIASLREHFLTF